MTADDAGKTWLDRAQEILSDWNLGIRDRSGLTTNQAANMAATNVAGLLQNRWNELSPGMQEALGKTTDILTGIAHDSLSDGQASEWSSFIDAFTTELRREVIAGGSAVKKAADTGLGDLKEMLLLGVIAFAVILAIK